MTRKFYSLLLFWPLALFAQSDLDYNWEANPELHTLDSVFMDEPLVYLRDYYHLNYFYDGKGELNARRTTHRILKVMTDEAIEDNNKIYLPYGDDADLIREQVRVINSKGKVFELTKSDIREATDAETEQKYRYFALKGIDIGSEIETIFIVRANPVYTGMDFLFQSDVAKKQSTFELTTPENLLFAFKSYNGLPEVEVDTTLEGKLHWLVNVDNIPPIRDEPFSNSGDNRIRLIFKLSRNLGSSSSEAIRYGPIVDDLFTFMYEEPSKSESKKLKELMKKLPFKEGDDMATKVLRLEQYLKKNISCVDYSIDELAELDYILTNKISSERGFTRLFVQALKSLDVKTTIVLTCDRTGRRMDPEFEAYNFLNTYLIYLPELDQYIQPDGLLLRTPLIGAEFTDNYGLFMDPVTLGGVTTAIARIDFIEAVPYTYTMDVTNLHIDFKDDIGNPLITMHHEVSGYSGIVQHLFDYYDEKDKEDLRDQYLNYITKSPENVDLYCDNEGSEFAGLKPFITHATFNTPEFIDQTADKYLFKVGEMIGRQSEMYFERDRVYPVENDYNRGYDRSITFSIPEGYTCSNLQDLEMDKFMEDKGKRTCTFTSHATLKGNEVTVTIMEYYSKIREPLSSYEAFAAVINAAADFNKVVLLFEPKP